MRRQRRHENRDGTSAQQDHDFRGLLIFAPVIVCVLVFGSYDRIRSIWNVASTPASERAAIEQSVHYAGCNEVRAAGKAPLHAGQPGYREGMDGDGDGIACEPHL